MTKVGELPVHEARGHLYIDGSVQRQHVSLMFDTGTQETTLSLEAINRLKLAAEPGSEGKIVGIGGDLPTRKYRLHFLLNGVDGDWERYVLAGNLGFRADTGFADGLIGPSFFIGHDIGLDLPDNKIILYFPEHDCSSPNAFLHGPLFKLPIVHPEQSIADTDSPDARRIASFIGNLFEASPRITVTVGGKTLIAAIDSGAPRNVLFLSGAEKIGIRGEHVASDQPTLAFGL
jgi:hypothetical protein